MGALMKLIDLLLLLFFFVIALAAPFLDAQIVLPSHYFPRFLVDLNNWYVNEYGHYLIVEKPHFFLGVVWIEILLLYPLALGCIYAILAGKSWFKTSCLVYGFAAFPTMVVVFSELLGAKRASNKLLAVYYPFLVFPVLAILRGLVLHSCSSGSTGERDASIRKKRA